MMVILSSGTHIFLVQQSGELLLREQLFDNQLIYFFLLSALLIGAVKWIYPDMFQFIFQSLFRKTNLINSTLREDTNALKRASLLLILNYFLVAGTLAFMLGTYFELEEKYLLIGVPLLYFFLLHAGLFLVGFISGASQQLIENRKLVNYVHQLAGLIFFPIGLAWLLNTGYTSNLLYFLLIASAFILLIRIIKGYVFAIQNKVSWYYIILYLCTLEIWPLLIFFDIYTAK